MKRIRIIVIAVLCILLILPVFADDISASTAYNSAFVKDHLESQLGGSYPRGLCLSFVKVNQQYCYGMDSSSCCAQNYAAYFTDSYDKGNIPIGADVFFSGGGSYCPNCGRECGHIGIYVGDGYIVHSIAMDYTGNASIRKDSIQTLAGWGYTFTGWGWHGNVALEYKPEEYIRFDITVPESYPAKYRNLIYNGTALYGGDIFFVQKALRDLGYSVETDGYYGPGAASAVKAFQTDRGLSATGVVDDYTWECIAYILTEKYSPKDMCAVLYNMNGGEWPDREEAAEIMSAHSVVDMTPERNGYLFLGWAENPDARKADYVAGDVIYPEGDMTLYAVWLDERVIACDVNEDGVVNAEDLSLLLSCYGQSY